MEQTATALLGQLLLASDIITAEELQEALRQQASSHRRLGEILLTMGAATEGQLQRALRTQARLRGRPDPNRVFILVVDDDPEVGAVVGDILEGGGYRVGIAQNESEALAALIAAEPPMPAAVILDLGFPQTGGIELLTVLRKMGHTQGLPVIILTGRPDFEPILRDRGLAVSAFLAKPVSARYLLDTVEAVVHGRRPVPAAVG